MFSRGMAELEFDLTWPEMPREKLREDGVRKLSDMELVMLLVQSGTRARSLEEISSEVLALFDRKSEPDFNDFLSIGGLGIAKASLLCATVEMGRRRVLARRRPIRTPDDIYNEVRHYATRKQENLIVLALNGAHEIISMEVSTIGLVNMTVVHPREVFSNAIKDRACAIVLAHNHPSGRLEPSKEDIAITKRIKSAGVILGISLLDHLIITEEKYYSFLENGMM